MYEAKKKHFLYLVLLVALATFLASAILYRANTKVLQTAVLPVLVSLAEAKKQLPPDLAIEKVTLEKISDPTSDFNFYKYKANIILENNGWKLENSQVVLSGSGQKHLFVKNSTDGFSLDTKENYIIEDYEVLFDGNYNGGEVTLEVSLQDKVDYNPENNFYSVSVLEIPSKLKSIHVEEVADDGTLSLNFDPENFALLADNFEVFTSKDIDFDEENEDYREILVSEKSYAYNVIENSESIISSDSWVKKEIGDEIEYSVKFSEDPLRDEGTYYVYLKATEEETGNFAVSDVLKFSGDEKLNRAAFAKVFVDLVGLEPTYEDESYFEDVNVEEWFAPYVATLHNEGLIYGALYKFSPNKDMTRGEALKVVMDYFDADLVSSDSAEHFDDVEKDNPLYPYVESFYSNAENEIFNNSFGVDFPLTKKFLNHLVNVYQ